MKHDFDKQRLIELVGLLCDEVIDQQQFDELEKMLQDSQEARKLYHVCTTLNHNLENENYQALHATTPATSINSALVPNAVGETIAAHSRYSILSFGTMKWLALSAVILLSAAAWMVLSIFEQQQNERSYAQIVGSVNVRWESPKDTYHNGQELWENRLRIRSGVVNVQFNRGASVAVRGPADFEIINENKAFLHRGNIAAYVPKGAEGFRVDTPHSEVVDLGTEFGLSVDTYDSQVHVFSGEVEYSGLNENEKTLLTAGLAVSVDKTGNTTPVELTERSFEAPREVLWTRYHYATSIATQFATGISKVTSDGVPGRIGGGWTGQWAIDCENGTVANPDEIVSAEEPLGIALDKHLNVIAKANDAEKPVQLRVGRGFESYGNNLDSGENYIVQFLVRINSDVSKLDKIQISDRSFDQEVSDHAWSFVANCGPDSNVLKWRGLPLRTSQSSNELVLRQWTNPDRKDQQDAKDFHRVESGEVYRVVVEVQPKRERFRVSLSDGRKTLVGDWTNDTKQASEGDRLERRLEWLFEGEDEISVSIDSIRIQNDAKFEEVQ